MKKYVLLLIALILVIIVAGCTQDPPTPAPITVLAPTSDPDPGPYPAPTAVSAYPAPGNGSSIEAPTPVPIDPATLPTPDPELGSAEGVFKHQIGSEIKPVSGAILYLAHLILDSEGNERVASFNRTDSPRATTNAEGEFIFVNIEPGRYSLVFDIVVESFLLSNPEDGGDLIATIEADQVFDFGELIYEDLPIQD